MTGDKPRATEREDKQANQAHAHVTCATV
jgi:hypothetical protein